MFDQPSDKSKNRPPHLRIVYDLGEQTLIWELLQDYHMTLYHGIPYITLPFHILLQTETMHYAITSHSTKCYVVYNVVYNGIVKRGGTGHYHTIALPI